MTLTTADWRVLHQQADAAIPGSARVFIAAVHAALADIDPAILEDAIRRQDYSGVFAALAVDDALVPAIRAQYARELTEVYQGTASAAAQQLEAALPPAPIGAPVPAMNLRLNLVNPYAVRYAETRAADLVTRVSDPVRQQIRDLVARGIREGITPAQTAKQIRQIVGLDNRRAQALANFRRGIQEQLFRLHPKTAPSKLLEQVDAKTERYYQRLLRDRALTIARNETMEASAWGRRAIWEIARAEGYIGPDARRFFIVTPDERLCRYCAAVPKMNPDGVPLDQPYQTPLGPVMVAHLHVRCRCGEVLAPGVGAMRRAA